MTSKNKAIQELLGRVPSKRYNPKTVLSEMAQLYPAEMHPIADHLAQRMEEAGGIEAPAGRKLAATLEAELLALRSVLLSRVLNDGLLDPQGDEHKHLRTVLRITDQLSRLVNLIGLDPPPKEEEPINTKDLAKLWDITPEGEETTDTQAEQPKEPGEPEETQETNTPC